MAAAEETEAALPGEEAEEDFQQKMLALAEESLRKAELEQAKEVGYVVVSEPPADDANTSEPLPRSPGDAGGRLSKLLRQKTFFVNHGVSLQENLTKRGFESYGINSVEDWRLRVQKATGAVFFQIATADGRTLDGYTVPPRGADNSACAILFHANAMICLDMALWAKWYSVRGITAVVITMGGYAESSFVTTSELTTYFDAQAAVDHAAAETGLPLDRMLVHGLSIGGALASAAAAANPGLHCTVDQTFVNAHEVALTCAKEFSSRVPSWLIKASVSTMFRSGITDPRLERYVTDQYDNENKATMIQGSYFVFWAFEDNMMLPDYAVRLFQAWSFKYESGEVEDGFDLVHSDKGQDLGLCNKRVAVINGGHCAFFGHDSGASKKYENYLQEIWDIKLRTSHKHAKDGC